MAKKYRFYNDLKTVEAEYITDGTTNHETFFITELRSVNAVDIQAGLNLEIEGVTETTLKDLASDLELNLEIMNDSTLISDTKGGAEILTYSLVAQTGAATIDSTAKTVDIEVENGTTVTALVATFTLSSEASAVVGATAQVSASTANNFTSPVVYKVTSEAGKEVEWTVTVTVA